MNNHGHLVESLVVAKLSVLCDIQQDQDFDHRYKLDLIINRFKNIAKLVPIGVQITTRIDDLEKLKRFAAERKKNTLVNKSAYVVIHPDVDVNSYGAELIYSALVSFAFSEVCRDENIYVYVSPDVSYRVLDLDNAIKEIDERQQLTKLNTDDGKVTGEIYYYNIDKQFGYIRNGNTSWRFIINAVQDAYLKNEALPNPHNYNPPTKLIRPIPVCFVDKGKSNENEINSRADQIFRDI